MAFAHSRVLLVEKVVEFKALKENEYVNTNPMASSQPSLVVTQADGMTRPGMKSLM